MSRPYVAKHDWLMVDVIELFWTQGFQCYPEFEIFLNPLDGYTHPSHRKKIVIDLLAINEDLHIFVEANRISQREDVNRWQVLRERYPHARIYHLTRDIIEDRGWTLVNSFFEDGFRLYELKSETESNDSVEALLSRIETTLNQMKTSNEAMLERLRSKDV